MKLGPQDSAKLKWAGGLFAVAVPLAIYNFWPAQAPAMHEQKITTAAGAGKGVRDPRFRAELLERRQLVSFDSGRNIFMMREDQHRNNPGAGPHDTVTHDDGKPPSTTETPLPIDLKFFGYLRKSGEPKTIFVSRGDAIFLAQEGDLVALRYKILEIKNNSALVQDVLNNQQQSLVLLQ